MQRHRRTPRPAWREKVAEVGLTYHSHADGPYWDESVCYEFTAAEIHALEAAAHELHFRCIDAAEAVIENGWWDRLGIPDIARPTVLRSWERDDFSLYGRFDLAFGGQGAPKLLEYNADTPTALVEAAVAQWFWLQETHPDADQFNSVHERLVAAWQRWAESHRSPGQPAGPIHFSCVKDNPEDEQTVLYLRDTCEQAGIASRGVHIEDLGWDLCAHRFVDLEDQPVRHCFKLYPWEWMWQEPFADHVESSGLRFVEPAWKLLLSSKAMLPLLCVLQWCGPCKLIYPELVKLSAELAPAATIVKFNCNQNNKELAKALGIKVGGWLCLQELFLQECDVFPASNCI